MPVTCWHIPSGQWWCCNPIKKFPVAFLVVSWISTCIAMYPTGFLNYFCIHKCSYQWSLFWIPTVLTDISIWTVKGYNMLTAPQIIWLRENQRLSSWLVLSHLHILFCFDWEPRAAEITCCAFKWCQRKNKQIVLPVFPLKDLNNIYTVWQHIYRCLPFQCLIVATVYCITS